MSDETIATTKRAILAAATGGLVLLLCWFVWWGKPPQIGADKEAIQTVDALFTAFTSRNTARLAQCEEHLHALRDAGELPPNATDYLDGLIKTARGGNWRKAAQKLFDFMKAQRREAPSRVDPTRRAHRRPDPAFSGECSGLHVHIQDSWSHSWLLEVCKESAWLG